MKRLSDYIVSLREKGEFCFTSQQALDALDISKKALVMSLVRLRRKKQIVTLSKAFHLIISPEYRIIGCLQPDHFIEAYMQFLKLPYYVCLLSAAGYYGAAHQKPQVFQVTTNKQLNSIKRGRVVIKFNVKQQITDTPISNISVPTGYVKVSTPEATAMDLLLYNQAAGGLNHIATVLTELVESMNPEKLLQLANSSNETAWVQKLGWVLEQLDPVEKENRDNIINLLKNFIKEKQPSYIPLLYNSTSDLSKMNRVNKNTDWKVIANYKIESDT